MLIIREHSMLSTVLAELLASSSLSPGLHVSLQCASKVLGTLLLWLAAASETNECMRHAQK
jgi:hypothetical protein